MKVILLQNIKTLGETGDIRDVSDGYARNFLIPQKLAEPATVEAIKNIEARKSKQIFQEKADMEEKQVLAEKLKGKKIIIKSKAKNKKLFGSISAKDVKEALEKENLIVSQECIIMKEAIKKTGAYSIAISLSPQISSSIILEVQGE